MKKILILFIGIFFLFICARSFALVENNQTTDIQKNILEGINAYRLERGLTPLKLEGAISKIATSHSEDMAENAIPFGHDGFKNRMEKIFQQFHSKWIAENVAYAGDKNSQTIINLWLNSKGHRKNIEGNYNLTGIGIAKDKDGSIYATQIFLLSYLGNASSASRIPSAPGTSPTGER